MSLLFLRRILANHQELGSLLGQDRAQHDKRPLSAGAESESPRAHQYRRSEDEEGAEPDYPFVED
eukprot:2345422-Prorocentrum_lima.AAC.1